MIADIIELAITYGRDGYRPVMGLLRYAGWAMNAKRMQRTGDRGASSGEVRATQPRAG